jgi:RHS repeat-associated protein
LAKGVTFSGEKQRFAGTERDYETLLDYMGARYYRSVTGRFNAVDPGHANGSVTRPQSWNAYAYASNNPLRFVDPDAAGATGEGDLDFFADFYYNAPTTVGFSDYALYLSNPSGFLAAQAAQEARRLAAGLPVGTRAAVQRALDESNARVGRDPGGFRESGFFTALAPNGTHTFIPTLPGHFQRPPGVYDYAFTPDPSVFTPELQRTIASYSIGLKVHVHPSGWYNGRDPQAPTPDADIRTAPSPGLGIVIGAGDKRVYFYDRSGVLGQMSLGDFMRVVR